MRIVLKHAGKWLLFQQPERVLRAERLEDVLPMLREAEESGLFAAGFVSYEAAPALDPALKTHPADGFPLLCLALFQEPEVHYELEEGVGNYQLGVFEPSVSKVEYISSVAEIKKRIAEGATYQVNYTYRLNAAFSGDAWSFFLRLLDSQKTDYAAFIDIDDYVVCSVSPELFFNLSNGKITSRPMKGTASRGRTLTEDIQQAEALRSSEKERAENIMIVDMIRNDIGRIAEPGSVETLSCFDIKKYPTLWQMTSTVSGKTDTTFSNVWKNLFPCASITGAPKAKTMEIIQELETSPRRVYTGAIGFLTPRGDACFSVAIRTALIKWKDKGTEGTLEYGVGGGIVWDSDPEAEYKETGTKTLALTGARPEFQLLETMLWEPGKGIFLLKEHLRRLSKSAAYFDIQLNVHAVFQALEDILRNFKPAPYRIRLLVSREGKFEFETFQCLEKALHPLRVALAKEPVDSQDVFLFHKTTNRAIYEKVKRDFPDCDEVILWNEKGEITEGCTTNVVIRKDEKLLTPPVECGLLAGTFREHLLQSGEIEEAVIYVADLMTADELFLINSVRKWQKANLGLKTVWNVIRAL